MYNSSIFASSSFSSFCLSLTLSASATLILSSRFPWRTQLKTIENYMHFISEPSAHHQCISMLQIHANPMLLTPLPPFPFFFGLRPLSFPETAGCRSHIDSGLYPAISQTSFQRTFVASSLSLRCSASIATFILSWMGNLKLNKEASTLKASAADGVKATPLLFTPQNKSMGQIITALTILASSSSLFRLRSVRSVSAAAFARSCWGRNHNFQTLGTRRNLQDSSVFFLSFLMFMTPASQQTHPPAAVQLHVPPFGKMGSQLEMTKLNAVSNMCPNKQFFTVTLLDSSSCSKKECPFQVLIAEHNHHPNPSITRN